MNAPVMSAGTWATNGELIADVHRLYPLDCVRDVTYGRGLWWAEHRPNVILASDIKGVLIESLPGGELGAMQCPVDFRYLPDKSGTWPVVAFDPPYIARSKKQAKTSTLRTKTGEPDFGDRYGLDVAECNTPEEVHELILHGMCECKRVLAPGGIMLLKAMNYVVGARHRAAVPALIDVGVLHLNMRLEAQFVHVSGAGAQPTKNLDGSDRAVNSPRANWSTLMVFRKLAKRRGR